MQRVDAPAAGDMLFVSGIGPDVTNWAFTVGGLGSQTASVEHLDHIASFVCEAGDRLYRIVCSSAEERATSELIVYDPRGIVSYQRLDGLADPHGVAFDGEHLIVPCSALNEIWRIDTAAHVVSRWRAPGEGDAWHINGVCVRDGRTYASAFGTFASNADMIASRSTNSGIIFDVETQRAVVHGLHCPHDPSFLDGGWLVCDSYNHRVLLIDPTTNRNLRAIDLGGWTRGMAVFPAFFVVGISARRHDTTDASTAALVVVDRRTWEIVDRVALPCSEINSVARISSGAVQALRTGFRTNDYRVSVDDRREMFRLVGGIQPASLITPMAPLESADRRVAMSSTSAETAIRPRETLDVDVTIENFGTQTLFSNPPHPVVIAVEWRSARSQEIVAAERLALRKPIAPGERFGTRLELAAPDVPDAYVLRLALVQEWVAWFDDETSVRCEVTRRDITAPAQGKGTC